MAAGPGDHVGGEAPRGLAPGEMLDVWESGRGRSATGRALTLLAAALPHADPAALAALPIGTRDRLLLELRAACFGSSVECVCDCPACGETTEFAFSVGDLLAGSAPGAGEAVIEWEGYPLRLRPVTSGDLLALQGVAPDRMPARLLARCAEGGAELPLQAVELAAAALAELDPGADLRFSLGCPACGGSWSTVFDIASYLWSEVEMAARRLLPEIHALACAYGWSEAAILALPPARRQSYLALVGAR